MLVYIKPDDLVVVKNIPSFDEFTITKVSGPIWLIPIRS